MFQMYYFFFVYERNHVKAIPKTVGKQQSSSNTLEQKKAVFFVCIYVQVKLLCFTLWMID